MADKSPKIKPGFSGKNDTAVDGFHRTPSIDLPRPPSLHRLDLQLPSARPDSVAAMQMGGAAPDMVISAIERVADVTLRPSIADYWIPTRKVFGEADAQGIRVFKQRQFVAVSSEHFVQVVREAESGLFRATLARELKASGPQMVPDAEGRFWHPIESRYLPDGVDAPSGSLRSVDERLAALFPVLSQDARATLRRERLKGDPLRAVARLEAEYFALVEDLGTWARQVPSRHPVTGLALTSAEMAAQRAGRERFAQELQDNWSRKATSTNPYTPATLDYDLDVLGSLPHLSADFSHVRELSLSSTTPLDGSSFLSSFPGVRYLTLSGLALKSFPVEVYQMRELMTLTLDNCDIRLSEATVEGLAHIEGLTLLDLSNNPLVLPPDIRFMRRLDSLYLSNTGLAEVPVGLFESESLAFADLGNNEITRLPDELFELPDVQPVNYNFRSNPLDEATLQRVKTYLEGTGLDRKILIQVDGDIQVAPQVFQFEGEDSGMESS
ncbi:leucine-rich repeat domain-containing protein [Pseudomonas sp. UV AK001]|uniref:leucine-rich repeat domain-containing protein n=1 Tax=Pseudomonas sp. UV AK001 TaxID=3384791 RepID=UPI0038D44C75